MATSDFGVVAQKVNASKGTIIITNTDNGSYLFLQDARMSISHQEYREPTVGGTNVYYSGNPNNVLNGTLLYSTDDWAKANIGFASQLTVTGGGEYPTLTLEFRLVDNNTTAQHFTFTAGAKINSVNFVKAPEGAVKIEISYILFGNPVVT